jgi:hypothetical protein
MTPTWLLGGPSLPIYLTPRGAIAQLGERLDRTQEVSGSNPLSSIPFRGAVSNATPVMTVVGYCTLAGYPRTMSELSGEGATPEDRPAPSAHDDSPDAAPLESVPHERPQGMLPARERRRSVVERGFVRIIATGGIIGIATVLGAVLVSQDVAGWIVGLATGLTSVILAALLWSSRQL